MFNNFFSYYLQICADDDMFCCSQNWISLHMLNALGPSRVLCAEWLAPCHRVFLKDDSPSHMPVTWEHRSEVLTGAPMEEWPGNICLGRKGSGEEEIQEFNSLLTPRGVLGMGDREGKWSCICQIPVSSNTTAESLVLNEKPSWASLLLPDSRERNRADNFSVHYFMTDFLPLSLLLGA